MMADPVFVPASNPLEFWSRELIVGEGPDRGKVELLAREGEKSVVLQQDAEGVCWFDQIEGMEPKKTCVKLRGLGKAPVWYCKPATKDGAKEEYQIWPVVNGPRRKAGQKLEGYLWSQIYPPDQLGIKKEDGRMYRPSADVDLAPPVQVNLDAIEVRQVNAKDVRRSLTLDGQQYFICRYCIVKAVSANKFVAVVSFAENGRHRPYIKCGDSPDGRIPELPGKFWQVCKSGGESDFGGLLEYAGGGKWSFHPYNGDYRGCLNTDGGQVLAEENGIALEVSDYCESKEEYRKIFLARNGNFIDL